jgi:hypothetical protein
MEAAYKYFKRNERGHFDKEVYEGYMAILLDYTDIIFFKLEPSTTNAKLCYVMPWAPYLEMYGGPMTDIAAPC